MDSLPDERYPIPASPSFSVLPRNDQSKEINSTQVNQTKGSLVRVCLSFQPLFPAFLPPPSLTHSPLHLLFPATPPDILYASYLNFATGLPHDPYHVAAEVEDRLCPNRISEAQYEY